MKFGTKHSLSSQGKNASSQSWLKSRTPPNQQSPQVKKMRSTRTTQWITPAITGRLSGLQAAGSRRVGSTNRSRSPAVLQESGSTQWIPVRHTADWTAPYCRRGSPLTDMSLSPGLQRERLLGKISNNCLDLIPLVRPLGRAQSFLSSPWGITLSRNSVVLHKIWWRGSVREDWAEPVKTVTIQSRASSQFIIQRNCSDRCLPEMWAN